MKYDLAVVGAGPVGLAVAIEARLRGLQPIVLEGRTAPLEKACGEGIMPDGVRRLHALGVEVPAEESHPFRGVRYLEEGLFAEGRFAGAPGLGVPRSTLSRLLLARANELDVDVRFGSRVQRWETDSAGVALTAGEEHVRAAWLVGADGLHSSVRRHGGLDGPPPRRRPRFGVRRHFAREPWTDLVEVYLGDAAEAYVTPVGPGCVGVAILFSAPGAGGASMPLENGGSKDSPFERLLSRFPALEARLSGSTPVDQARGAGPLRQRARSPLGDRVLLVGDAAGYVDALTGQGVELGLASAASLVAALGTGDVETYRRERSRLTRRYRAWTELLLGLTARRWSRRALIRVLRASPSIFDRAVNAL